MAKSNPAALRRPTNVSLNSELLQQARELDINISRACEQGLSKAIKIAREEQWLAENAEAIASSNEWVERNGLPLARYRQF